MNQIIADTFDCRVAFAGELITQARRDPRIVAVCNDSVGSSNLGGFQNEFPKRLINVGIAEQDMVGVAAGRGQWRFPAVRLRGGAFPDRTFDRTDQGRCRL